MTGTATTTATVMTNRELRAASVFVKTSEPAAQQANVTPTTTTTPTATSDLDTTATATGRLDPDYRYAGTAY